MIVIQDVSGEMMSHLLLDRLRDDVIEVVDAVLSLNDVRCVLTMVTVQSDAV